MTIVSDDSTEIEEERRLCYVGITRAEKILNLTSAKSRMVRGETQMNKVSRFINEIPKEYMHIENNSVGNTKKAGLHMAGHQMSQIQQALTCVTARSILAATEVAHQAKGSRKYSSRKVKINGGSNPTEKTLWNYLTQETRKRERHRQILL